MAFLVAHQAKGPSLGRLHLHVRDQGQGQVDQAPVQPVHRPARRRQILVHQPAAGFAGQAHIAAAQAGMGAADQQPQRLAAAVQAQFDAGGVLAGHVLHAQALVQGGVVGLGLQLPRFGQAEQGAADLALVARPVQAVGHAPLAVDAGQAHQGFAAGADQFDPLQRLQAGLQAGQQQALVVAAIGRAPRQGPPGGAGQHQRHPRQQAEIA